MKLQIKERVIILALFAMTLFIGCEKSDSDSLFGDSYVFIPQSTVSGGQNLHYLVPTGANVDTYNYKIDVASNTVNVLLGVSRSGMEINESYSVDITTKADTINQLIANGKINLSASTKPVVLLPATAFNLPSKVDVTSGNYMASFNLAINMPALKAYVGKKVALCVAISKPSKYLLSPTNNKVIVLIDVDALKLP